MRGPGETQLETDRRLLRARIKMINKRLSKVKTQRDQSSRARRRAAMPAVSLVGYTNAGKSTLFNALSGSDAFVANQLFATLDPTLRRIDLPGSGAAILADTVGFIRDLPHDLVEAFSATLEETRDANLLIHVTDSHDENRHENILQVEAVLKEIGADHVPQLSVFNKIDLFEDANPRIEKDANGKPIRVWVSAETGEGMDLLLSAIASLLYGDPVFRSIILNPDQGKLRAKLYEMDAVLKERIDDKGNWLLNIRLAKKDFDSMIK